MCISYTYQRLRASSTRPAGNWEVITSRIAERTSCRGVGPAPGQPDAPVRAPARERNGHSKTARRPKRRKWSGPWFPATCPGYLWLSSYLRTAAGKAAALADLDTVNLLEELAGGRERTIWMLSTRLPRAPQPPAV